MRGCNYRRRRPWCPGKERIRSSFLKAVRRPKEPRRWRQKAVGSATRSPQPQTKFSSEPPLASRTTHTPIHGSVHRRFDQWISARSGGTVQLYAGSSRLSCTVLQLVPLERVPKLVVAKIERGRRGPLVEPVAAERVLEKLALIFGDGRTEVSGRRGRRRRDFEPFVRGLLRQERSRRLTPRRRRPGRMERIELDFVHRPLRILVAVHRALDHVAKLANVSG